MPDHIRQFPLGLATITIVNIGDVHEDVNKWFTFTDQERTQHQALLAQPARLPIQSIHIALPEASILVDAGAYDYPPGSPQLIPGYTPPPDLLTSLRTAGIYADEVTHLVVTHAHGDHFNALTELDDGVYTPVFPDAYHYLGRGDWDAMQGRLADPDSLENRTFGVLQQRGQLEIVEDETDLAGGVCIIPAPGESPGHQIVQVYSYGHTLYCIGDLYHLTAEVEQPHLTLPWNDGPTNRRSRAAFNERASKENALIVACHIAQVGRIKRSSNGFVWVGAG
jgi:glyoxylase-like metal-dependent hydrolase (beta-lactamase superfamily II)